MLAELEKLSFLFVESRAMGMAHLRKGIRAASRAMAVRKSSEGIKKAFPYNILRQIAVTGASSFKIICALKVKSIRAAFPVSGAGRKVLAAFRAFQKAAEPVLWRDRGLSGSLEHTRQMSG